MNLRLVPDLFAVICSFVLYFCVEVSQEEMNAIELAKKLVHYLLTIRAFHVSNAGVFFFQRVCV